MREFEIFIVSFLLPQYSHIPWLHNRNVRSESIAIVVARPWTQLEKDK
jgi:hypothetical protein